ncbi:unnamed protein product [Ascophyllum nodosum]
MDAGGNVDNEGYYKVLEVGKKADAAAITKAYRKLAKKKHPDKGGDPEEFKMLAEAYEVLSDPEKRRLYDRLGREGVQGAAAAAGGMDQRQQADDLFRSFFGRFSQPQTVRMRDVVYEMEVTLEELCEGGAKRVRIWTAGDDPAGGDGRRGGRPGERVAKDIDIDIRRGMRSGTRIVVEGGVEPVEEGIEPGDLVFVLREAKHRMFRRLTEDSPHLAADVTVTLSEALTGFVRPISLLDGRTVHFRPEEGEVISPGAVRKLPGCGMPIGQGVKGDLYLRFAVEFPSAEASFAWGSEERKTLEDLLPPKPSFPREKRNRPVKLSNVEPSVQSRFNAGVYDRPLRGQPRSGIGAGNPFGFFGL